VMRDSKTSLMNTSWSRIPNEVGYYGFDRYIEKV